MDSQRKPKSWFSSISSLVGVRQPAEEHEPSSNTTSTPAKSAQASSSRHLAHSQTLPNLRSQSRPSLFEAREVFGGSSPPDSPVKRASDTTIAQRKILDRPQGPSSRLHGAPAKTTNFSSATTPRSIFKNSFARDAPAFTFTSRASAQHTTRPTFPPDTPGRSYRATAPELNGRGMAKTTSSDLFQMQIPEPDHKLTGEVIAKQIPKDSDRTHSIYASEYLAHLCPTDFSEAQRNQWFCIMDLRRLKFAADDIFKKKDWKLNILNFAKEYEKSRSLIMLRYGLYEFRTVKVSKDTFQKWKQANNIPDSEDEVVAIGGSLPKANGTEGILRAGKRKAQEDVGPRSASAHAASNSPQHKRPRAVERTSDKLVEREPLTESLTPSLNKAKRRAGSFGDDVDSQPSTKMAKPSATRSFFERVANSPAKEPAATTPSISVTKAPAESNGTPAKKANPFAKAAKPAGSDLARSVLTASTKLGGQANASGNIFGYLSDSSVKGSGNDNADADGEDTESDQDEEEESDPQDAKKRKTGVAGVASGVSTPGAGSIFGQATPSALASTSSSETGENAGRSLFDRVQKDAEGQPVRMLSQEAATPQFGSKPPSPDAGPSSDKEPTPVPAPVPTPNRTWTPDTPIKFASSATPAPSLFSSGAPKATPSLFGAKPDAASAPAIKFGSSTPAAAAPETAAKPLFGSTTPAASSAGSNLFGAVSAKPASGDNTSKGDGASEATNKGDAASTQPPAVASSPLSFGGPKATKDGSAAPTLGSGLQSQTLFGSAPKTAASSQQPETPSAPSTDAAKAAAHLATLPADSIARKAPTTSTLFGGFKPTPPEQAKAAPLFGTPTASQPASAGFSFGAAPGPFSQATPAATAKPLFGASSTATPAASAAPKSLFGATTTPAAPTEAKAADEDSMQMSPAQAKTVSMDVKPPSAPGFSFGAPSSTPSSTLFGTPTPAPSASQPKLFGTVNSGNAGPTFSFGGGGDSSFKNPFMGGDSGAGAIGGINFNFAAAAPASAPASGQATPFQFGAGPSNAPAAPAASAGFSFGGTTQPEAAPSSNLFGGGAANGTSSGGIFNFGNTSTQAAAPMFGQQPTQGLGSIFGSSLAPPMGGTSTGTNTPFTIAGASSLATTPATGTPEPGAAPENADQEGQNADGDEAPQEQISLTEGGPGEEGEDVVLEVRAKAMRLTHAKDDTDSESPSGKDSNGKAKSPWQLMGVGPLRLLKDKENGAVRLLLRVPRGDVAMNKRVLPDFSYKPEPGGKYVKLTTADDKGSGLETWMIQLKTKEQATELANALEEHKGANKT